MDCSFELRTTLEYRLRAAVRELNTFKTGERYVQMKTEYTMELRHLEKIVRDLKQELSKARCEMITLRNQWFDVFEDMEKEKLRELNTLRRLAEKREQRALKTERQLDAT